LNLGAAPRIFDKDNSLTKSSYQHPKTSVVKEAVQIKTKSEAPEESTLTYESVLQASLEYFQGDELAATTWINKYAVRNKEGELMERTPADMHKRMAREFARIEARYASENGQLFAESLSPYGRTREPMTEERIF